MNRLCLSVNLVGMVELQKVRYALHLNTYVNVSRLFHYIAPKTLYRGREREVFNVALTVFSPWSFYTDKTRQGKSLTSLFGSEDYWLKPATRDKQMKREGKLLRLSSCAAAHFMFSTGICTWRKKKAFWQFTVLGSTVMTVFQGQWRQLWAAGRDRVWHFLLWTGDENLQRKIIQKLTQSVCNETSIQFLKKKNERENIWKVAMCFNV